MFRDFPRIILASVVVWAFAVAMGELTLFTQAKLHPSPSSPIIVRNLAPASECACVDCKCAVEVPQPAPAPAVPAAKPAAVVTAGNCANGQCGVSYGNARGGIIRRIFRR